MTETDAPAVGYAEPRAGWRGIAREFITIVAGVLVALAGQAWWEGRQDADRERAYVHQLLADVRSNERQFTGAIAFDSTVAQALASLGTALYAPRPLPSDDSLRTLLRGQIFSSSNLETRSGTLTALLSSGDIRLIHTDSLRAGLVAYAAQLQNDDEMFRLYYDQAFADPGRIARALPFARRLFLKLPDPEVKLLERREAGQLHAMRDDPQLAGILFSLQAANNNRLVHMRLLQERTVRLRQMLEAEKGN